MRSCAARHDTRAGPFLAVPLRYSTQRSRGDLCDSTRTCATQAHQHPYAWRTLTDVLLPDGTNVNHTLVKEGWCWWYRKYAPLDTELEQLEKSAREAKKGLWVDPAPIPPWIYRKARRGQSLDLSDLVPLDAQTEGVATLRKPFVHLIPVFFSASSQNG